MDEWDLWLLISCLGLLCVWIIAALLAPRFRKPPRYDWHAANRRMIERAAYEQRNGFRSRR